MVKDYKPGGSREKTATKSNPFIAGLLTGLLLGVGLSIGVAILVNGGSTPFTSKPSVTTAPPVETGSVIPKDENPDAVDPENAKEAKPRFDFYTILPGTEKQVTEEEVKKESAQLETEIEPAKLKQHYYLQVGAFKTESEADNMKASLALQGFEAVIQSAEIPDKGTWHRVRVGPFVDIERINKARSELALKGFEANLIKVDDKNEAPQ